LHELSHLHKVCFNVPVKESFLGRGRKKKENTRGFEGRKGGNHRGRGVNYNNMCAMNLISIKKDEGKSKERKVRARDRKGKEGVKKKEERGE